MPLPTPRPAPVTRATLPSRRHLPLGAPVVWPFCIVEMVVIGRDTNQKILVWELRFTVGYMFKGEQYSIF